MAGKPTPARTVDVTQIRVYTPTLRAAVAIAHRRAEALDRAFLPTDAELCRRTAAELVKLRDTLGLRE